MFTKHAGLLLEPALKAIDVGSPQWFALQKQLIKQRPLLRYSYDLWYKQQIEDELSVPAQHPGQIVELGSGGSYLRDLLPGLIDSDTIPGVAGRVIDARNLPFERESVRAIMMTHVFHHIPDVEKFLREAARVLVPGGVISIIDVPNTPLSSFLLAHFHPEPYDDRTKEWSFESRHNMDANAALSGLVFKRDRDDFHARCPLLNIESWNYLPWLTYMLSGGVTRKNLVPSFLVRPLVVLDKLLTPLRGICAIHWHIRVRKKPLPPAGRDA